MKTNFIEQYDFYCKYFTHLMFIIITTHVNTVLEAETNYFQCFRTCYSVEVNLNKAAESQLFFPVLFDHRCTRPD